MHLRKICLSAATAEARKKEGMYVDAVFRIHGSEEKGTIRVA